MEKEILKTYKVRLYPNKNQEKQIDQTLGNCRWYWNYLLGETNNYKKEHKGSIKGLKHKTECTLKKEYAWLKLGSSRALYQERRHLKSTFSSAFSDLKVKERKQRIAQSTDDREFAKALNYGFPKFKKKGKKNSYSEPQIDYTKYPKKQANAIEIKDGKIKILKLGWVSFRNGKQEIPNSIRNVTITKDPSGQYFASVLTNDIVFTKEENINVTGIDRGLKEFAITSSRDFIHNPKFLRRLEDKLALVQRWLSRKKEGSNNRYKNKKRLAKIHKKISNQRNYFLHKVSNKVIDESQVIILEDLNVKGMLKNKKLSKAISDVSWSEFERMLRYKSEWYGRILIKIDRFFPSSKMCSKCGHVKRELGLNERTYVCEKCGIEIDRDLNASINIRNEGLRILKEKISTGEYPGSNAWGDEKVAERFVKSLSVLVADPRSSCLNVC